MQELKLNGKQQEVLALPARGHTVVLGTAGSGKTTIALLRAKHLANIPDAGMVLLVTFNRALVEYMRGILYKYPCNLMVENYHKFALGYLRSRGINTSRCVMGKDEKRDCINEAINIIAASHPEESTLKRPLDFFVDEISFIEQFGYTKEQDYYDAERIGRASSYVKRENRPIIFMVYQEYLSLRSEKGYLYDYEDIALYTYQELCEDTDARRYTHIIVDEGQDFSPMMIRSLVMAVGENGSFTFFGDVAQQIYGSRLSWRDSGIDAKPIWQFDVNYRNPSTICDFAKDITASEYWRKSSDMISAASSIAKGPKPAMIHFSDIKKETEWVLSNAVELSHSSSTVIIVRKRDTLRALKKC